jgi:hypothetical protein
MHLVRRGIRRRSARCRPVGICVDHYNLQRPHRGRLKRPPDGGIAWLRREMFASCGAIDLADSFTNTRRSHEVTPYSAPAPPSSTINGAASGPMPLS